MSMHDARKARRLQHVQRFQVVPTLQRRSVADHSYGVAVIASWLAGMHMEHCDPEPIKTSYDGSPHTPRFRELVMEYALGHDLDEALTGDTPGGASTPKDYTDLVFQNGQVWAVVKLADLMEALIFCREEAQMGHQRMSRLVHDYQGLCSEVAGLIHWDGELRDVELKINKYISSALGPAGGDQYG